MRLSVYYDNGERVADAELDPAHPLHELPNGSLCGHVIGHFTPGPGFCRLEPMLNAFKDTFKAGDVDRALAMSGDVDALGFWGTDPAGRRFRVSNVQFNQGGLLFFAGSEGAAAAQQGVAAAGTAPRR